MRRKAGYIGVLFAILAALAAGCSKTPEPTQADIVKAVIQQALKDNCRVMTPTIKVAAKGERREDGTTPYTVRYSCMHAEKSGGDGRNVRQTILNLYQAHDSEGNPVWLAK
jgi:hypothetical protein